MYLVARQGALHRFRLHQRAPRGLIDSHFGEQSDALTVLIPSYAEEPDVVRLTMWSAALQEYPDLRVVLLIDDPPTPTDEGVLAKLTATRQLAGDISQALEEPAHRFTRAYEEATRRCATGDPTGDDVATVAGEPQ